MYDKTPFLFAKVMESSMNNENKSYCFVVVLNTREYDFLSFSIMAFEDRYGGLPITMSNPLQSEGR